ncbi:hypothetical protein ACFQVD_26735 [Streptosporangium amethystogenes subsp. fukuiense]|uniref:Helix-turn-helix domain-containing protein n=1 Tax=Streptosporangium amethystogenes subsp. fukuiense TaxID=698418 RepID=A0ABW2T645_9ACTN
MSDKTPRVTAESAEQAVGERPAGLDHELIDWAWAQPITNNPGARIVLMCMARRVDDAWECTASQEEVAVDAMMSSRSVRRHMEQLEVGGFIQRRKRFDEKGRRLPDRCRLNPGGSLPANLSGGDLEPAANMAGRQVSPAANMADRESDHRPGWPLANRDETGTASSEPPANLASGQFDLWPDWPVVDAPETDIPRSEPVANLTSGQIGRAISSSPTENYENKTPSSSPKRSKSKPPADAPPREDVEQLCARLLQWLIKKNYRQRPQSVPDGWRDAARKLLDLDEIPLQEALDVLDWSQKDLFWRNNVHSMVKFRDKYGDLEMKSRGQRASSQDGAENSAQIHQLRPTGTTGTALSRSTTDDRVAQAQALKAEFATQSPPTIRGEIVR